MRKFLLLVLLMLSSSLAGCISGDDGELQVELSDDQVENIVNEYFSDFINNTSVTVNDYTSTSTNTTTNHFSNGSMAIQNQDYFVIDFFFNKSDFVTTSSQVVDYINRTFQVNYSTYNYSTNDTNEGIITLSCSGYYLIGLLTENPTSYWNNSNNYQEAWDDSFNSTVANLYYENRYSSYVRNICDPGYSNTLPGLRTLINLYEIEIPQGKAIQCVTPLVVKQLWVEEGYYSIAYGERYANYSSSNPYQYRYQTSIEQNWDDMLGYTCGDYPLGSGDRETTLTLSVEDRYLESSFNYRIYLVYLLIDVNPHTT